MTVNKQRDQQIYVFNKDDSINGRTEIKIPNCFTMCMDNDNCGKNIVIVNVTNKNDVSLRTINL